MQHFTPQPARVMLKEVVDKEAGLLREAMMEKQLRVENNIPAMMTRMTDENFLSVILRNLLQNAVKYSITGGTIIVAADDQHLYLTNTSPDARAAELDLRVQHRGVSSGGAGVGFVICARLSERACLC